MCALNVLTLNTQLMIVNSDSADVVVIVMTGTFHFYALKINLL